MKYEKEKEVKKRTVTVDKIHSTYVKFPSGYQEICWCKATNKEVNKNNDAKSSQHVA